MNDFDIGSKFYHSTLLKLCIHTPLSGMLTAMLYNYKCTAVKLGHQMAGHTVHLLWECQVR